MIFFSSRSYVNPEMNELRHPLHDEWIPKINPRDQYEVVDTLYPSPRVLQRQAHRHAEVPNHAIYRGSDVCLPCVPEYLHQHQAQRRSEYDQQNPHYNPRY
jgi:hypothetical protein